MFTGIVRDRGRVAAFDGARLVVETSLPAAVGDSIAVDGVCLTVVAGDDTTLAFAVVPETVARSTLGSLSPGAVVNLEPAVRVGDELGGHIVQGHVDDVGRITAVADEGDGRRITVAVPPDVRRYIVEKGSVTLDGVSLTVTNPKGDSFEVALIPHTLEVTTFGTVEAGREVNVEVDMFAKYIEKLVEPRTS